MDKEMIASFSKRLRKSDIIVLEEVDSTNNYAKSLSEEGAPAGTLVIARKQTAGRGRMGRTFVSPEDSGIYMSLILRPGRSFAEAIPVTAAAAVGVCRAVRETTGRDAGIKWVNDIYIAGKKICGILVEAVPDRKTAELDSVVIGIGIDYMKPSEDVLKQIPEDVLEKMDWIYNVSDLQKEDPSKSPITRSRLAAKVADEVIEICSNLAERAFIGEYKKNSIILGKKIVFISGGISQSAVAIDIDNDGGLVVKLPDGIEKTLYSGEISVKIDM